MFFVDKGQDTVQTLGLRERVRFGSGLSPSRVERLSGGVSRRVRSVSLVWRCSRSGSYIQGPRDGSLGDKRSVLHFYKGASCPSGVVSSPRFVRRRAR